MEDINWKNIEGNSTQALMYVCQQHRVHPKNTSKSELVKQVTLIRDSKPQFSPPSSTSSSREQSPVMRQKVVNKSGPRPIKAAFNYLRTPNPTVITIAFVCLITSIVLFISNVI